MSSVAVCTDSSSLLTASVAASLRVAVARIEVALDGEPFDEVSDGADLFYDRLATGAEATTAPPSPGAMLELYTDLAARGADEVLSIHLDRRLSSAAASCEIAAEESPVPVTVVDLATASYGVGLCVKEAVACLSNGAGSVVAADAARRLASRLRNAFVAPSARGGRIPATSGWSVFELTDGVSEVRASGESRDDAVEAMTELVSRPDQRLRVAVGYAAEAVRDAADLLAGRLAALRAAEVERYRVAPAVGAHTGGLSFGMFWWPADNSSGSPRR
jgi:DegV family protein with EDD domain